VGELILLRSARALDVDMRLLIALVDGLTSSNFLRYIQLHGAVTDGANELQLKEGVYYFGVMVVVACLFCGSPNSNVNTEDPALMNLKECLDKIVGTGRVDDTQVNDAIISVCGTFLRTHKPEFIDYYNESGVNAVLCAIRPKLSLSGIWHPWPVSLMHESMSADGDALRLDDRKGTANDLLLHALTLQGYLNSLIRQQFLTPNTLFVGSELNNLVELIEMTYRGDLQLSAAFWVNWRLGQKFSLLTPAASSHHYALLDDWLPICALLSHLLATGTYCPDALFRILNSFCCDSESTENIIKLLSTHAPLITICDSKDLIFENSHVYPRANKFPVFGGLELHLSSVPVGSCKGITVGCAEEDRSSHVIRWSRNVCWWDIMLDLLLNFDRCPCVKIESSISALLLARMSILNPTATHDILLRSWESRLFISSLRAAQLDTETAEQLSAEYSAAEFAEQPETCLCRVLRSAVDQDILRNCVTRFRYFESVVSQPVSTLISTIVSNAACYKVGERGLYVVDLLNATLNFPSLVWQSTIVRVVAESSLLGQFGKQLTNAVRGGVLLSDRYSESYCSLAASIFSLVEVHANDNLLWKSFENSPGFVTVTDLKAALHTASYIVEDDAIISTLKHSNLDIGGLSYSAAVKLARIPGKEQTQMMLPSILQSLLSENAFCRSHHCSILTDQLAISVSELCGLYCRRASHLATHCLEFPPAFRRAASILLKLVHDLLPRHLVSRTSSEPQNPHSEDVFKLCTTSFYTKISGVPGFSQNVMTFASLLGICARSWSQKAASAPNQRIPDRLFGSDGVSVKPLGTLHREAALPIDFSYLWLSVSGTQIISLSSVSLYAVSILSSMMDIHRTHPSGIADLSVVNSFCSTSLGPQSNKSNLQTDSSAMTYLQGFFGLIRIPTLGTDANALLLSKCILRCLVRILACLDYSHGTEQGSNLHSCVEFIGLENLSSICRVICLILGQSKYRSGQVAVLDLLNALIIYHPIVFSLLLSVHESSKYATKSTVSKDAAGNVQIAEVAPVLHDARAKDSALSICLLGLLRNSNALFDEHPLLLHKIFELLISMVHNMNHGTIALCVEYIFQDTSFWSYVTVPLMHDISSPLPLRDVNLGSLQPSLSRCYTILAHASCLRLVTLDRFGMLTTVGKDASKRLDDFFVKATNAYRFTSWASHYTDVGYSNEALCDFVEECSRFGYRMEDWATHSTQPDVASLLPAIPFGANYLFDRTVVAKTVKALKTHSGGRGNTHQRLKWEHFLTSIERINIHLSVCDAEMLLLQSFARFLEVYLLPSKQSSANVGIKTGRDRGSSVDHSHGQSPLCLSPAQSAVNSPSMRSESSFTGDRRSYEVISKLQLDISSASVTVTELRILIEKLRLLCSMLHHQFKFILMKTADPTRSLVHSRDVEAHRLDTEHLVNLLKKLMTVGPRIFDRHQRSVSSPEYVQVTYSAKVWLMSALSLVVECYASKDRGLIHSDVVVSEIFSFAIDALYSEMESLGPSIGGFTYLSQQAADGSEDHPYGVSQMCVAVISECMPHNSEGSAVEAGAWRKLLQHKNCVATLLKIFDQLSNAVGPFAIKESDFRSWSVNASVGSDGKGAAPRPPAVSAVRGPDSKLSTTLINIQIGICDVFLHKFGQLMSTPTFRHHYVELLAYINKSVLLTNYQETILSQFSDPSANVFLMGYSPLTGDESLCAASWLRTLSLVQMVMEFTCTVSDEPLQHQLFQGICFFIKKYIRLICLPLNQQRNMRYSLKSLELAGASITFFQKTSCCVPAWKAMVSASTISFLNGNASILSSRLASLLPSPSKGTFFPASRHVHSAVAGDADATESKMITAALKDYFIAVSADEKHGMQEQTIAR
jgi:hypothetical protein